MSDSNSDTVYHTLTPWYDENARVLILGTIPSVKSRECGCYYGHPQNRFWTTMSTVFDEVISNSAEGRRAFCKKHHIALWDVLASCDIQGSQDMSIRNPIPNDIALLISQTHITTVFTTGKKAAQLYDRYVFPKTHIQAITLPSTSPANRRWFTQEQLTVLYAVIRDHL